MIDNHPFHLMRPAAAIIVESWLFLAEVSVYPPVSGTAGFY